MVPDADRGGRLIPVVPVQAAGPVLLPALQAASRRALPVALRQVLREVSRPELPEALHPVLRVALPESLQQREVSPEQALWPARQVLRAVYRALAGAHQDVAVSRHARRARPEAHPVDAVARA